MREGKNPLSRIELKSFEGEFLYELIHSYELSPKLSEQILISAKMSLLRTKELREGQVVAVVVGIDEKSGKPVERMKKKKVVLILNNGLEDMSNLQQFGRGGLRQIIIQRITDEAIEQEGVLSQEDLSYYLNRSLTTIRKYLNEYFKKTGKILPLKGYVLDQGSLPTHKGIIISLYEQGISPADIVLKTSHSQDAVDRYIKHYNQIKKLIMKGLSETEIKDIVRRSMKVVREYIKLYYDLHPEIKQ